MKHVATMLIAGFLATTVSTAQPCPSIDALRDVHRLSSGKKAAWTGSVSAVLDSDLTLPEKTACIATKGRRSSFPALAGADHPLSSVLDQEWIDEAWMNAFLFEVGFEGERIDRILSHEWNPDTEAWDVLDLTTVSINDDERTSEILLQDWDGASFVNALRIVTVRDEFDNQVRSQQDFFENETWQALFIQESTIEDGLILQTETQVYNEDIGMIEPALLQRFSYDDEGRVVSELNDFWNADTQAYETTLRYLTVYSENSDEETQQFMSDDGMWIDASRFTRNYNDEGLLSEIIRHSLLLGVTPQARSLFEYDEMQNIASEIDQLPDALGEWMNDEGIFYTYDDDGDILEDLYQVYGASATWENEARTAYFYDDVGTGVESDFLELVAAFDVYPSPSYGQVTLRIALSQPAVLRVGVFDLLGRRVASLADGAAPVGVRQLVWDPQHMPSGLYLLRVNVDAAFETRPVVVIR